MHCLVHGKKLNAMLDPHEVTMHFEIGAIGSLKLSLSKPYIIGYFFNFAQATWRKIQCLGLAGEYEKNTGLKTVLKSFEAFTLVPKNMFF